MRVFIAITASSHLYSLHRGQFEFFIEKNVDLTVASAPGVEHDLLKNLGVSVKSFDIQRKPSILKDLKALLQLIYFFIWNRFDLVIYSSPKASLLVSLAAFITLQPKRLFILRGRVYENYPRMKYWIFKKIDSLVCALSDKVWAISNGLKEIAISDGITSNEKIEIVWNGSSNGIDTEYFNKNQILINKAIKIRQKLGIKSNEIVLLYSGRIRREKGIIELVYAFEQLAQQHANVSLLIQGKFEEFDKLPLEVESIIFNHPKIHIEDWALDHRVYYAASDIFVFPSHREGFGTVLLEAASMEIPSVVFNVMGCSEAVIDGVSGVHCTENSIHGLQLAIKKLLLNEEYRIYLGKNAREIIIKKYEQKIFHKKIADFYCKLLDKRERQ